MRRLTILMLAAILAACTAAPPPLRIAVVAWPPHQIAYLAKDKTCAGAGRFELVDLSALSDAALAYTSGTIDAVGLTMDYALDFHTRDQANRVFMLIDESLGGDAVIGTAAMRDLRQLRGKRIGLENSALGSYMLQRLLDQAGLAVADVQPVAVDYADQIAAYAEGRVDVVITGEPARTVLLKAGASVIFSSKDIPGEIVDVFVARQDTLHARQDDFRHFTRCWFDALARYQAQPKDNAAFMGKGLGIGSDEFVTTMQGMRMYSLQDNRQMLGTGNTTFVGGVTRFSASLRRMGLRQVPDSVAQLFTDSVLPARP